MCLCSSNEFHFILYIDVKIEELYVRCCGANDFDTGFQDWRNILSDDVPDSCCHVPSPGCGGQVFTGPIPPLHIHTHGCLAVIQQRLQTELVSI